MFRSTITIYSEFDPAKVELSALAREAEEGSAICTHYAISPVGREVMPDEALEFFDLVAPDAR